MDVDYNAMQVGQIERLPGGGNWGSIQRAEYNKAQELSRVSGKRFEVVTLFADTPDGPKPSGYTIQRKR